MPTSTCAVAATAAAAQELHSAAAHHCFEERLTTLSMHYTRACTSATGRAG